LKKARKNFYELGAFAPGVPIIAPDRGDYRQSGPNARRSKVFLLLFLQKKKFFLLQAPPRAQ
jgi:hypothetical protein